MTMTPYGKGQGGSSTPGSASSPSSGAATGGADNYLVQRGYIEVVEDVRGTGDSNGSWGLFDPIQQRDAIKVLGWAAHLPHSNGTVGHLRAVVPGHRPAAARRRGRSAFAAEGDLPDGLGQRHLPRHVVHGRAAGLRVLRDLPGPHRGAEHRQPAQRHDLGSHAALRSRRHRVRPRQRAGQLPRRHDREHPQRRRRGVRRHLLAGAQPAERARARRRQPHPRLPGRRRVRHLPERRAAQLRRALQNAWAHRATTAPMQSGQTDHRALPADRRAVGAPQRLVGRRRPARARVVRHLAEGREDRHGARHRRRCTTTTWAAATSTRPRPTRSPARPPPACTSAPAGRSPRRRRRAP